MITSTQLNGQKHLCCTSQFSGFGIGDEPLVEWGILCSPGMKPNRARHDNTWLNEPHLSRAPKTVSEILLWRITTSRICILLTRSTSSHEIVGNGDRFRGTGWWKPKDIMGLNQLLMSLDCFEEERDFFVANRKSLSPSPGLMITVFGYRLGCYADIKC
jgi:hypothetical protein